MTDQPMTLLGFQWQYREMALTSAANHSEERRALIFLETMGLGPDTFPLGTGMTIANRTDLGRLPEGSVVMVGEPDEWRSFGMWARRMGRWVHVLGPVRDLNGAPLRVEQIAGESPVHQSWLDLEPHEGDEVAIRQFKVRAYFSGLKLARDVGWCGTYEEVVADIGIDASVLEHDRYGDWAVGESLPGGEVDSLPPGTVVRDDSTLAWYVTDGTIPRFSFSTGDMEAEEKPDEVTIMAFSHDGFHDLSWALPMTDLVWERLPVGTLCANAPCSFFIKARDGGAATGDGGGEVPDYGGYRLSQFGPRPRVMRLPEGES